MRFSGKRVGAMVFLAMFPAHVLGSEPAAERGLPELTLKAAVDGAVLRNPMLKRISAEVELAEARTEEAKGGLKPYVDASSSFTRSNNPVFVFGSLMEQDRFTSDRFAVDKLNDPSPENNIRTTLNVMMPVFDARQTEFRVSQAKLGVEGTAKKREIAEQALRLEVIRSFYGALLSARKAENARESVKSAEADLKRIKDMNEVGLVVRSDLLAVEVQLADFRQTVLEAEGEEEIAREALNTILGMERGSRPVLKGDLSVPGIDLPDLGTVMDDALKNRRELAIGDLMVRAAAEGVRGARSQYLPKANIHASYGLSSHEVEIDSTDWMVGVSVSMPIFDPGRAARISQAVASESVARAGRQADADQVSMEVVSTHRRLLASREKLKVAAGAVAQAAEAQRIVQDRYEVGLTTVTEVLRAGNALLNAKFMELGARYAVSVGYAEFLKATGKLTTIDPFQTETSGRF